MLGIPTHNTCDNSDLFLWQECQIESFNKYLNIIDELTDSIYNIEALAIVLNSNQARNIKKYHPLSVFIVREEVNLL